MKRCVAECVNYQCDSCECVMGERCDGEPQCDDKSDEQHCAAPSEYNRARVTTQ